jgi:hypothetical protein
MSHLLLSFGDIEKARQVDISDSTTPEVDSLYTHGTNYLTRKPKRFYICQCRNIKYVQPELFIHNLTIYIEPLSYMGSGKPHDHKTFQLSFQ